MLLLQRKVSKEIGCSVGAEDENIKMNSRKEER
jgi:hypothetical protein